MIQEGTVLLVADNSGAKKVRVIRVLGGSKRRYAGVGDTVICSVREADPHGGVKKGEVVTVVIVRTKAAVRRRDGTKIRSSENAGVLIDEKKNPKGTRVFGTLTREVRQRGFVKLSSLAPEVI